MDSYSRTEDKEQAIEEINEGISEYLKTVHSTEGIHTGLFEEFEVSISDKPLKRTDIEKEVESFVDKNMEAIMPILFDDSIKHKQMIETLGITNELIGSLGLNYKIDNWGQQLLYKEDGDYATGSDFIALAYAKAAIRTDSLRNSGRINGKYPHRYFLKSQNRYLCANDFGMRKWNPVKEKMEDGDPTNIAPYIQSIKSQINRIEGNIQPLITKKAYRFNKEMEEEDPNYEIYGNSFKMKEVAKRRAISEVSSIYLTNPKDRELLLTGISESRFENYLRFNGKKIAGDHDFVKDNTFKNYQNFEQNISNLERLIKIPSEQDKEGTTLDYIYSTSHRKPVIVKPLFRSIKQLDPITNTEIETTKKFIDTDPFIKHAQNSVKNFLAKEAIKQENSEVQQCVEKHITDRGVNSPFYYPRYKIYDLIKDLGVEKVEQILDTDDRKIHEQLRSLDYLKAMDYNISQIDSDRLKKQIFEASKLDNSRIWEYLQLREDGYIDPESEWVQDCTDWLKSLGREKSRELYREGKRMHWIAQQIWKTNPSVQEDNRFYHNYHLIDWERYDLKDIGISEDKITRYFNTHGNLISVLLSPEANYYQNQSTRNSDNIENYKNTVITLPLLIQGLESGKDLRGLALVDKKQQYLKELLQGNVKNNLESAIADWPTNLRNAVSQEEFELYYENANDYILLDPNGLKKYAVWRADEKNKYLNDMFKQTPKNKSDLDFRICLCTQGEEVLNWYKEAYEYLGEGEIIQDYLSRFNSIVENGRSFANLHDSLYWIPNIKNLEKGDIKSLMSSIRTMDEHREFSNLLPRYNKEKDRFKDQGPIQSLRELKKRVLAIESHVDLSGLPPQVLAITSAPGFNVRTLESMRKRPAFIDLVEGKLDEKQPFEPHRRLFPGRLMTETLKEGLGSRSQGILGTATNPGNLFKSLNQLIKGRKVGDRAMRVTDLLESVPIDLEESIIKLLQEQNVDTGPIVEAQIHAKSDPEGWVCGNYTDCCMPFGSSYNNDYMFNPSTQYFTIKYNGRIIAQSVVVDAINTKDGENIVILDNIEIANNYKKFTPLLSNVYKTFWTEYTKLPVKIGIGYSDLIPSDSVLEPNTYASRTTLLYSDSRGSHIYDLPKLKNVEAIEKVVSFSNVTDTDRDIDLITKMEAESYPKDLTQGKDYIAEILQKQRSLGVPGAASSFVIRQGKDPAGYLLVLPEESEVNPNEQVAHIYDMAILPKFRGTPLAGKMINRVLDFAQAYGVSIEAEARANTSYTLLMNERVRRWFESKGFYLTRNEKLPEYLGGEDFYFVRFENRNR